MTQTELRAVSTASPTVQVNAVNTRSRSTTYDRKKRDEKPRPTKVLVEDVTSDDEGETPKCAGCGVYGHTLKECRFTGRVLHIKEWIAKLRPDERRKFLQEYAKDRKETHEKYKKGLRSRKQLKLKIRQININAKKQKSTSGIEVHEQVLSAIDQARKTNPDIDFGTMDKDYVDFHEPELDPASYDSDISLE